MRVLLGGLVGAIASSAAWFFLEYVSAKELGWLAIGVGLITGLCVSAAAGAGAAESYGRAALAVMLTMLGVVGGRAVYAKVMQNVSQVTTIARADDQADLPAAEPAEDDAAAGAAEAQPEPDATLTRTSVPGGGKMVKPTASSYKEMEVVWMALAALAAYVTGKGSGKPAPVETVVVEEEIEDTPA